MTLGTSPQWGILSRSGAEANAYRSAWRRKSRAPDFEINWQWLARGAAGLHLLGLALIVTMGWHDPNMTASATIGGLQAAHLAFLMTTGAAAALLALGLPGDRLLSGKLDDTPQPAPGVDQLLTQMSHELRTPLNAMIGFSEVMLRELYGPLGHQRYQEYAAHISESGGQLLRSAEDALAVTETMSAVMADRLAGRCERVMASTLVREAWAGVGATDQNAKLCVSNCAALNISCERRATSQALQHLFREAAARAQANGTVEVRGRRRGGARSIEIRVAGDVGAAATAPAAVQANSGAYALPGDSLRVILARLLLEMQGGTLSLWDDEAAGTWSACVAFPPRG